MLHWLASVRTYPPHANGTIAFSHERESPPNWTVIGLRHLQRPDRGSEAKSS
jgi:hypothetical protein